MPELLGTQCKLCGKEPPTWGLCACPSCGMTICRKCATYEYGRIFCSMNCAVMFFHGDSDDEDESPDT